MRTIKITSVLFAFIFAIVTSCSDDFVDVESPDPEF